MQNRLRLHLQILHHMLVAETGMQNKCKLTGYYQVVRKTNYKT